MNGSDARPIPVIRIEPSPRVRSDLFALWSNRATLEHASEARFRRLSIELAQTGAHPEVQALCCRAADDEHRHAALCASMAERFRMGGLPEIQDRGLLVEPTGGTSAHTGTPTAPTRERVLIDLVAASCLGETLNASYLTASLADARDPATRDATHELLCDEVVHARLGWAHLAAEHARGDVAFLGARLPRLLSEAFGHDLGAIYDPPEPSPEFALLSRASRVALFADTLADVVFPGFEEVGIDVTPARAWLAQGPFATR